MRITKQTVRDLAAEAERVTGKPMIESINTPGDGRTHYVMAESMTSTYYGARTAAAYLLGVLSGADPDGPVGWVEHRPGWVAKVDSEFRLDAIPSAHVRAYQAGREYGRQLRRAIIPVGAWRVLSRREGRSFTRLGGNAVDAGPVGAGTLVEVLGIDRTAGGDVAHVRTQDSRTLRVMASNLVKRPKRRDRYSAIVTYEDRTSVSRAGTWAEMTKWLAGLGSPDLPVAGAEIGRVIAEGTARELLA